MNNSLLEFKTDTHNTVTITGSQFSTVYLRDHNNVVIEFKRVKRQDIDAIINVLAEYELKITDITQITISDFYCNHTNQEITETQFTDFVNKMYHNESSDRSYDLSILNIMYQQLIEEIQ